MKKRLLLVATALLFVLLFATFSAVSATSNRPIACSVDMVYDEHESGSGYFYWSGSVSGCILEGDIRFDAAGPPKLVGNSYHWYELFTIYPDSGGEISGYDKGVIAFSNFEFRSNGWVTDATPPWAHLTGNKFFEIGTSPPTSDPPIVIEDMLMRLVPAQRPG
jgi:hypothetical protein